MAQIPSIDGDRFTLIEFSEVPSPNFASPHPGGGDVSGDGGGLSRRHRRQDEGGHRGPAGRAADLIESKVPD
jgi:hypothetical protein